MKYQLGLSAIISYVQYVKCLFLQMGHLAADPLLSGVITIGVMSYVSLSRGFSNERPSTGIGSYGHAMLEAPVPTRTLKLSNIGPS